MNDEQTIYISPEDDLTTVRERLEQVQSRNVTLVVPAQTQLRSHVAWKLLSVRARELGKEVLIVSSDPQVRSVAHAVKFTVAHSLEATQQGYSRPVSRPTRANISRNARTGTPLQRSSGDTNRRHNTNALRRQSEVNERPATRGPRDSRSLREHPMPRRADDPQRTTLLEEPASATFGAPPAQPYPSHNQQDYNDYPQYDSTPPIHPLTPEQAEEEPDMLVEDYERARGIRRAASRPESSQTEPAAADIDDEQEDLLAPEPALNENATSPTPAAAMRIPETELPNEPQTDEEPQADNVEDMRTIQMSPLPEQQGHTFIEDFATDEPATSHDEIEVVDDISSNETRFIEPQPIEYVDNDDVAIPHSPPSYSERESARGTATHANRQEDSSGRFGRSNTPARRPRATGYVSPDKDNSNRPWQEALENDDDLPLEEYATRHEEQRAPDHHTPSRTGREPRPVQLPIGADLPVETHGERGTARHLSKRGATQRSQPLATEQQVLQTPRNANVNSIRKARRQPILINSASNRQQRDQRFGHPHRMRHTITTILIVLGLIAVLILLAFIIPTSTITLTLATHTYNRPLTVTASNSATSDINGQVVARTISQDFTRQGSEPATGSKIIDTGLAHGNVCFSNSSSNPITIPTNTTITTATGVQFKVTAESVIIAGTTCTTGPTPDPIVAVQPGETGNVQAGAINTIPATSLDIIAHASNTAANKLAGIKVVNLDKTTGGGRQQVSAITSNDLQHARNDLHKQLQNDINVWLKSLPNNGLAGQAMVTDALVNPPAVGTALSSNATTFQASVKVSVTVLFVDNNDLKEAAIPQINTALKTDKTLQNYMVANNSIHAIQIRNAKIIGNTASTLKISYTATAKVVTNINADRISQLSAGKAPDAARSAILTQIPGVTNVASNTDPVPFPTIAFWSAHITVKMVPSNP
jgi:hypothetical protein